jgi:hypothetical protein
MLATRKAHGEGAFVGQHANEAWAYLDRILELHSPYRHRSSLKGPEPHGISKYINIATRKKDTTPRVRF